MKMNYAPLIFTLFITAALTLHGDSYLGQIIDTGFLEANVKTELLLKKNNISYVLSQDCIDGSEFSFPSLDSGDATETWVQMLNSRKLSIGLVKTNALNDISRTIMEYVTIGIQEYYKLQPRLESNFIEYETDELALKALESGAIDVIAPSLSAPSASLDTYPRLKYTRPSCSAAGFKFGMYTFANKESFKELINSANELKLHIAVRTEDEGKLIQRLYGVNYIIKPAAEYTIENLKTDADSLALFTFFIPENNTAHYVEQQFIYPFRAIVRQESELNKSGLATKAYQYGNIMLRNAVDQGIVRLQSSSAINLPTEDEGENGNGDCIPSVFPSSKEKPEGTLYEVLSKGYITLGRIKSRDAATEKDKTIISSFKNTFNIGINIQYQSYNTLSELFDALDKGEIDATTCDIPVGEHLNDVPLRWVYDFSCSASSLTLSFFVNKKQYNDINDYTSLLKKLNDNQELHILCSKTTYPLLVSLFGSNRIEIVAETEAFARLSTSTGSVAYAADLPCEISSTISECVRILSDISVPTAMFFRRDKPKVPSVIIFDGKTSSSSNGTRTALIIIFSVFGVLLIALLIVALCCCGCCNFARKKNGKYTKFDETSDQKDYVPPSITF